MLTLENDDLPETLEIEAPPSIIRRAYSGVIFVPITRKVSPEVRVIASLNLLAGFNY